MTDSTSARRADDDRFARLLMEHLAGELSEAESEELWRMAASHPQRVQELMSLAWQASVIQSRLKSELISQSGAPLPLFPALDLESDSPSEVRLPRLGIPLADEPARSAARWRVMVLFPIFFAALVISSLLLTTAQIPLTSSRQPSSAPTSLPVAATIAGSWNCVWAQRPAADGNLAAQDILELREGIAQLRFVEGAEVLLAAPVRFRVDSAMGGGLEFGALTAKVPVQSHGFTVSTPQLRVVDLGTEFGVRVSEAAGTEVHVFSGQVETHWREASGAERSQLVAENQSFQLEQREQRPRRVAADSTKFVRSLPTPPAPQELAISPEYVAAVHRSKPLAYWRFESLDDGLSVRDEMGRAPLKALGLVEIRGTSANRRLSLPLGASLISEHPLTGLEQHEYSVELWFQTTSAASSCLMSIQTESKPQVWRGSVFLGTSREREESRPLPRIVRGMHRWPPSSKPQRGSNLYHRVPDEGWQHVVLVKTAAELQLFSQGVKVLTTPDATLLGGRRYRVTVGRFHESETARPFQGEIDEMAIYQRALSDTEIAEHFNHVKIPVVSYGKK